MRLVELLLGRPLRSDEEAVERIGVLTAIPVLGLDALASASYGPEAALTVLLPLGATATIWVRPITLAIVAVLTVVALSYAQTIPAYPNGGGSFTVAKENLGRTPGLLAAAALCTDYVLNVAVAISAGIGAICSAEPRLLPYTLPLCLGVLALLTIVNLRGVRESGLAFLLPTYLFVASLLFTFGLGAWKVVLAHGHPTPVVPPPRLPQAAAAASLWLLLRAFASGCTALTGVEAVSNAVPIFREPKVHRARRTLAAITAILMVLLLGISLLSQAYGIGATEPGKPGYQSVISQIVGAVTGRGWFYFVTMGAVFSVLTLSANTSFADFPRVWRLLALDEYLPPGFAHRGRRLVYSRGILSLAGIAAALLIAFGGITDRLIPLFAVGAFLAFTMSQLGMVMHWRRTGGPGARRSLVMNAAGALATSLTLVIIVASKFTEGAWLGHRDPAPGRRVQLHPALLRPPLGRAGRSIPARLQPPGAPDRGGPAAEARSGRTEGAEARALVDGRCAGRPGAHRGDDGRGSAQPLAGPGGAPGPGGRAAAAAAGGDPFRVPGALRAVPQLPARALRHRAGTADRGPRAGARAPPLVSFLLGVPGDDPQGAALARGRPADHRDRLPVVPAGRPGRQARDPATAAQDWPGWAGCPGCSCSQIFWSSAILIHSRWRCSSA